MRRSFGYVQIYLYKKKIVSMCPFHWIRIIFMPCRYVDLTWHFSVYNIQSTELIFSVYKNSCHELRLIFQRLIRIKSNCEWIFSTSQPFLSVNHSLSFIWTNYTHQYHQSSMGKFFIFFRRFGWMGLKSVIQYYFYVRINWLTTIDCHLDCPARLVDVD